MNDLIQKIMNGRTDLAFDFVKNGGDANHQDQYGRPLIIHCAYYGDVSAVKFLIDHGASIGALGDNFDLNGAAFHGHWQLCQYLIESGADVNHEHHETGETVLHACLSTPSRRSTPVLVRLFLHAGANVNSATIPHKETGCFMRDAFTKGETPLHRAAAFADEQSIQFLLEAGADKTAQDINGETPIGWASWHGRPGRILALLSHGRHRVHRLHEERLRSDHGFGWGAGMMSGLVGEIHL